MKQMNRIWSGLTCAAVSFVLAGCAKEKPEDTAATPTKTGNSVPPSAVKIAFIPKGNANSFWQTMKAGADKAATDEKITVDWQAPSKENDITAQINVVQTQTSSGVSAIVLVAVDGNALVKPVDDAIAKGIPVITVDSGISKDSAACYIATDNVEGGRRAARALVEAIGEDKGGNLGMLFFLKGAVSNDERENGFKEELAKHPKFKLVAEQQAQSPAEALDKATNMLTANPTIVGLYAVNEPNGVGAANYLRQSKKNIKLVAFDASADEVSALNEGIINALIVQDPYTMGLLGVQTALKAVRKEPIEKKFLDSGITVVTKANLQTPEVQKLLDPAQR